MKTRPAINKNTTDTSSRFNPLNLLYMKNSLRLFIVLLMASSGSLWAQYGIGTNNPNQSAALEIVSPDKGVLIPSVSLTSTSVFAPITGTSSTTHNGMIVWNTSPSTASGLTGVGFYYWENHPTTPGTGNWYRLTTTGDEVIPTGTVTNSILRWDGTAWVETTTLLTADTAAGTATLAANTTVTGTLEVSGNTTVTGELHVDNNATVTGTLEVTGNSTVTGDFTVQGSSTLASTTLGAVVYDFDGDPGTEGQVLSTTGTSTNWIDSFSPDAGTVTNSTLRWDGTGWVETTTLLTADTAGGTATLAANTTVTGTLEVSGNTTVTGELHVDNNATVTGTLEVTGNKHRYRRQFSTLASTTLGAVVYDFDGDPEPSRPLAPPGPPPIGSTAFLPWNSDQQHLRWDGTGWVETTTLLTADTAGGGHASGQHHRNGHLSNTTVTGELHVDNNATVTGTLEVTDNATVTGDFTVQGSSTLASTTLGAVVYDFDGDPGTEGQVLSTTGTSTNWIDSFSPDAGTVTNSTLRWDGTGWVETTTLLTADTAGGTATLAANTTVTGTLEVSGNTTVTGELHVDNNATVTGTLEVTDNATVTGNLTASGTLSAQNTASLEGALLDSFGNAGTAGQVLSSTGTSTQWVDANAATLATMSATGNVTSTISLLMLTPGSNMTVTLQDATALPVGYTLKIRRNQGYTGSGDLITLDGFGAQTIDGVTTRNLNVGYQSITLLNIGGGEWVSID